MREITVNLTYLRDLAGGDIHFMVEMISLFLNQTPDNVNNLVLYLQQHDWENLKKLAHKMNSGVALMGIQELQNFLTELQTYTKKQVDVDQLPTIVSELKDIYQKAALELQKVLKGLTQNDFTI